MNYINQSIKDTFFTSFDDFLEDFLHKFTLKFYYIHHYKADRLYLANFKFQLKQYLNARFVYGHFFWCQRRNILDSQCRICTLVFKWDNDDYAVYQYSNNFMDFWDTHLEKVFCENTYLYESEIVNRKECVYFENFYTPTQLTNMFGVISCRIFLNLGKRCFFVGRMSNPEIYRYYAKHTKKLFYFVCNNVKTTFANRALFEFKPFLDYDPIYLKLVNL